MTSGARAAASSDYERIAEAIDFIVTNQRHQPSLGEVAEHLHLSPFHFQRLFTRWAGVTPKQFLQVLTVERAKELLEESGPLLDVAHEVGLSGGSRLHDHFVQIEAMSPGEFKSRGEGATFDVGVHDSPFGPVFVAMTSRGVSHLAFETDVDEGSRALEHRFPRAEIRENPRRTRSAVQAIFEGGTTSSEPLRLHVSGTNFQVSVWRALLDVAPAHLTTYARVAGAIGRPSASRAVGQAVGANPVAIVIPCHRVIQQSGALGGYHWGTTRKLAIQAWESARSA